MSYQSGYVKSVVLIYLLLGISLVKGESSLFVVDKYASNSNSNNNFASWSVGDLVSHLLGTPVLNPAASRANFPTGNIFDKDAANLFVVLQGVDQETLSQVSDLKVLKHSGQQMTLKTDDDGDVLTTMFTGYPASVHGVTSSKCFAYVQTANLADVVSQTFGGRSLIMSGSANYHVSATLNVNQLSNPFTNNAYAFYWDSVTSSVQNAFTSAAFSLDIDKAHVIDAVSKRSFILRNKGDRVTVTGNEVVADFAGDNIRAVFDLSKDADFAFFSEIELLYSMVASLQSKSLKSLVEDSLPDLFSFVFSSLEDLTIDQKRAALLLLDGTLTQVISDYQSTYNGRAAIEIVFVEHRDVVESPCSTSLGSAYVHASSPSLGDSDDPDRDMSVFQIVLWFSIVLILALIVAVYPLFGMDTGAQPSLLAPKAK